MVNSKALRGKTLILKTDYLSFSKGIRTYCIVIRKIKQKVLDRTVRSKITVVYKDGNKLGKRKHILAIRAIAYEDFRGDEINLDTFKSMGINRPPEIYMDDINTIGKK